MKIIFAGTPAFAATALEALFAADHEIALVLTQPDRPAGRGMKTVASPVKLLAMTHGVALLQPLTLKSEALHAQLMEYNADVMIVAAYGLILPATVLNLPRYGCLNIHASLLPRWRGAAPIQRAILAGDQETGITIMQMDTGLDTGAMLHKARLEVESGDTTQTLHDKLSKLGAHSIVTALAQLQQGRLTASVQNEALACYAPKINKTEAAIDWQQDADQINRLVRAFNPSPGAYAQIRGNVLKIWQAKRAVDISGKPGEIIAIRRDGIIVACGRHAIILETLQKPGGKKLGAAEFLTGYSLQPGEIFDSPVYASAHSK
ncbi:MAG: methionyl-tRNA formyltransferase [Nitrosomonas sp.]|nr:MAG: methionyl-tRNA formyltransferase [Nitrosomonas sp.]